MGDVLLAIDPGPTTCGVVEYDAHARRVLVAHNKATVEQALDAIDHLYRGTVLIEQVQSQGQSGASLLRTSEVVGRLGDRAVQARHPTLLVPRRLVLRALDISGKGNRDSMVRTRCIESHGGDRRTAVGTKADPGPLYGVSGHAWQALGLALARCEGPPSLLVERGTWWRQ